MTLNLKETGTNIRDVYTCLIRQEKDINTYGTYVDQEFSTLNPENTLKQIPYTSMSKEGGCNIQSSEGNNTYDGSSIKKINKEFRSTSDRGFNIESMSNFIFELDTLPRYGICEKSTQTILTMRDIDNLEAYKTIPTRELISNMFRTSPDMYFKIFGKYLNENIKCESSEILNKSENEDLINSNSSSKIELNKNKKNLKIKEEFFSNKNVTFKRNKGFNTSQTPDKIISRKRKYPINYNEFNKNGTNDKINVNENIKKNKINSFTNYDSFVEMSGNKNHNEQQPCEKKSDNKINIKRKIDYFKKTKIKIIHKNPLIKSLNNLNKINNPKNQYFDKDLKLEENVVFDNPIKNNSFDLGDNNSNLDSNKLKQSKFEALINQHQSDYFPGLNNLNNKNVNLDGYAIRQNQDEYFLSNNDISFQNNNQLNNFVNSSDKNYLDSENFADVRNNNKCNSSKTKETSTEDSNKNNIISDNNSRDDSNLKISEDIIHFNGDFQINGKLIKNADQNLFSQKNPIKKLVKKFDPYEYYKNECIQSHKDKNENDLEKECQRNWKYLDKDMKSIYLRMAEEEKKKFKKNRKLNSNLKDK